METRLSDKINNIEASATLLMDAKARAYEDRGIDIIKLSLGEPDFKTPPHICAAAKHAIEEGIYFSYPPVAGYTDLRKAIANKYTTQNKVPYQLENIVVSNGAKQSIANTMFSLFNPGDEVIIFSPFWVSYEALVKLTGAKPVHLKGHIENDFKPTPEQLRQAINKKTRGLIFSSPCNPTGTVWTKKDLETIAEIVLPHENLIVIADEIYEHINFDCKHTSIASIPKMVDRTVTVNGFSKGFAMTGWRVGYIAAPIWIAKACAKMQGQFTSANCSIAQRAALAAITGDLSPTYHMAKVYKKRRTLVYDMLKSMPNIQTNYPSGAFYFFCNVSYYYGLSDGETKIHNGRDLCMYILEKAHVSLVPGQPFGEKDCIRMSYAASEEKLIEALARVKQTLSQLA